MSDAEQPANETGEKAVPDTDYTGLENVKSLLTFDQRKAVTEKASQLSAGDSVRINDRVRPLTVVPKEETNSSKWPIRIQSS